MSNQQGTGQLEILSVSVVIPVYSGEATLPALVAELAEQATPHTSPDGHTYRISEVLLVWDRGPGNSDHTIRALTEQYHFIRPIWLSRNFGQHPATLAGMTSASGDWIVTMDEDGQQDPSFIPLMLDTAYRERAQLVYAAPINEAPHGFFRNAASNVTKWFFVKLLAEGDFSEFNSYRLIQGEIARSVAAYTGPGVYLDVALNWVVATSAEQPVTSRVEGRPASNYSFTKLLAHFLRLVVSSGTRPLLFVSVLGAVFVVLGAILTIWIVINAITGDVPIGGWASTMVAILVVGGGTLLSLGIIAQYVGAATNMSLGKPLYVVTSDPKKTFDS